MKVYPRDASAPRTATRAPVRYHVGVEFQTEVGPTGIRYLLAACNSQLLLDGNTELDAAGLPASALCSRPACKRSLK